MSADLSDSVAPLAFRCFRTTGLQSTSTSPQPLQLKRKTTSVQRRPKLACAEMEPYATQPGMSGTATGIRAGTGSSRWKGKRWSPDFTGGRQSPEAGPGRALASEVQAVRDLQGRDVEPTLDRRRHGHHGEFDLRVGMERHRHGSDVENMSGSGGVRGGCEASSGARFSGRQPIGGMWGFIGTISATTSLSARWR